MEYRLDELFDLQMGKTPSRNNSEYWDSEHHKWISIGDLSKCGKYIYETKEYLSDKAVKESGISLIPANTVIMSFKLSIGKTAITPEPMYSNEAIMSFRDKKVIELMPDYVYYMFSGKDWDTGTNKAVMGKTLNKATLSQIRIKVHSLPEQQQIVSVLDKAKAIIDARLQELQALDDLIKARFVEMFGDYDLSHQRQNWIPISEIGKVVGGSTPKTSVSEYWNGEYRWISPAEIQADSGVIYDSVKKITKAGAESCSLQELPIGTVILSSRAPVGKVAIAGNTFYCNQGFKNIICNSRIIPRYLYSLLLFNTEYLNSLGRGATFKEISKSIVENIKIPLPEIAEQKEFETFVKHIDKSRVVVQKALDEAQLLFDSLMQQYFG
ncbi:MAG: restriction endonuclease subunit S [Clostridia bacterium]|nr:restriction endonuclease subunit S [Clostridia bacterium]